MFPIKTNIPGASDPAFASNRGMDLRACRTRQARADTQKTRTHAGNAGVAMEGKNQLKVNLDRDAKKSFSVEPDSGETCRLHRSEK